MPTEEDLNPLEGLDMSNIQSIKKTIRQLKAAILECEDRISAYEESNKFFKVDRLRPIGTDTQFALNNISRFRKYYKELNYALEVWRRNK